MSPTGYLLLTVGALSVLTCMVASPSTQKPICMSPTPQKNITLEQVMGDWYVVEIYSRNDMHLNKTTCNSVKFIQANESTIVAKFNYIQKIDSYTMSDPTKPWAWVEDGEGYNVMILYLSSDDERVAFGGCISSPTLPGYTILSKELPLTPEEFEEAYQSLAAAGVKTDSQFKKWQSSATCTFPS